MDTFYGDLKTPIIIGCGTMTKRSGFRAPKLCSLILIYQDHGANIFRSGMALARRVSLLKTIRSLANGWLTIFVRTISRLNTRHKDHSQLNAHILPYGGQLICWSRARSNQTKRYADGSEVGSLEICHGYMAR